MIEISTPARTVAAAVGNDRLSLLVHRIAASDRAAFRCLYAFLALRVWRDALRALSRPADARAVTRSTFVEVWHLAGHHLDSRVDVRAWIGAITARRAGDRLDAAGTPCALHDGRVHRELVVLLGAGHATMRTGTATFLRVDDLDRAFETRTG
jgi:DNA-directed RNA polymerase specialized sigma24 family protein